ncbi:hypothetical protein [Acinetobacter radioresistens]|uniref:hypothetical protein n=1 Tax=Acinetobacter radioresistens TaxID=40216 RepID=UPI0020066175|nr:hypothetical protein [Acinetobacter radioresistens]MCK4090696.1 hypothetical protein [Acinetobacter radioresistens]MCK4108874.1 hypothetical protein [Acinetobacter radioresistens]
MSNNTFEEMSLTIEEAKDILKNKPDVLERLYWHKAIKMFFIPGPRKNALVQCGDTWKSSTRYNPELEDPNIFIPISKIIQAVNESAP